MNLITQIKAGQSFPMVLQFRLHHNAVVCELGGNLHTLNRRVIAQLQRNTVVDSRRPSALFEVSTRGDALRQYSRMRTDTYHQIILAVPANRVRHVKDGSGEARKVLSNLRAVQPDGGAKLSFVDAQDSKAALFCDFERTVIPEPVTILPCRTSISNESGGRQLTFSNAILDYLAAVEKVHISERWSGGVSEARDGRLVVKARRYHVAGFRSGNVPFAVK